MEDEESPELNMTSMIDVVFLLLIFFMTSLKFKTSEGRIQSFLPKDKGNFTSSPKKDLNEIRIKLLWTDANGNEIKEKEGGKTTLKIKRKVFADTYYQEDKGHPSPDYSRLLSFLLQAKASHEAKGKAADDLPIKIDARPMVPYKHVMRAVNACVEAGLPSIEFAQPERPF